MSPLIMNMTSSLGSLWNSLRCSRPRATKAMLSGACQRTVLGREELRMVVMTWPRSTARISSMDGFLLWPWGGVRASEPAPVRERDLLAGDELDQRGLPFRVHLPGALDGRGDLRGLLDALGLPAHRAAHVRVAPADVSRAVAVVGDDQRVPLDRHRGVVQDDGGDGDAAADGRLEIEARHAEGGVAHEIHAELVGRRELGAHDQAQPRAEGVRLAPAHVAPWRSGAVERDELVPWAAGIVRHDRGARIDGLHELPDHAVRGDGDLVRRELGHPLLLPRRSSRLHL